MLARSPQGTWQGQCCRYPLRQIGFKVLRENRYGPMEASMLHKCNRQINWRGWGQCFSSLNQFLIGHVIGAKLLRSQYNRCRKCHICLFVLELTDLMRFKLELRFTYCIYILTITVFFPNMIALKQNNCTEKSVWKGSSLPWIGFSDHPPLLSSMMSRTFYVAELTCAFLFLRMYQTVDLATPDVPATSLMD